MIYLEWSQINPNLVNTKPYQNVVHLYSTSSNPIRIPSNHNLSLVQTCQNLIPSEFMHSCPTNFREYLFYL